MFWNSLGGSEITTARGTDWTEHSNLTGARHELGKPRTIFSPKAFPGNGEGPIKSVISVYFEYSYIPKSGARFLKARKHFGPEKSFLKLRSTKKMVFCYDFEIGVFELLMCLIKC